MTYQSSSGFCTTRNDSGHEVKVTLSAMLQMLGDSGWELAGIDNHLFVFKRPKQ